MRYKSSPRYYFAHQVMKSLAFQGNNRLGMTVLNDPDKFKEMIDKAWKFSNETFNKVYKAYIPELYSKAIDNDKLLVLFSTPAPKKMLDTYYCAFVAGGKKARYFTVEKGMGKRIILGEWTTDGGHANYGEIENSIEIIAKTIEDKYKNEDIDKIFEELEKAKEKNLESKVEQSEADTNKSNTGNRR